MGAPRQIERLVERYDEQREAYESGQYKETEIRVEFIDPFFKALGWDVHNEQGYAEAYKDVIHEQALKIGGATEAPDSCFRIGGVRKFFVECKKPSVNIKDAPHPAYQLRRYGWSAKLPLSTLTDFEEFAVYDCRVKPGKNDSSSVARVMYLTFEQYADKWDEMASIFSREAVLKGSFDKFAEGARGKRGTASVDDVFLEEIERWRDLLARNIALRNPDLSQRELNFSVQRTIDRIIFLRICEDRGIEPYGRLMTLRNGDRGYPRLCEFFQRADERYNSGLFHFQGEKDRAETPDELTLTLILDDKVLRDILANLYYPESPYEFSVLSADILGQVYERFLGKVIRLTTGHQAKVEEKPEVRKAGGVFYTPDFITKAIVRHTIGPILQGKTARQVAKLRFCDMACGSGSFLIEAFQFLIDWHRNFYVADGPQKHGKVLYRAGNDYRLTTAEKKRIVLNNIFGVDIDTQAVEVTKLSLLLKVLEGESQESITKQFELFHQRALPDLGSNIK
ncbi:MAG: restriction endonuclease subunit M, partial [Lentisphaerales bacterium]